MAEREYADTGYGPIDAEHRAIGQLLRELVDAVNDESVDEARRLAHAALKAVITHFAHEERLMEEGGYPKRSLHRDAHDSFLKDAGRFVGEVRAQGLTDPFRGWATRGLVEWFRFHIMAQDAEFGRFLVTHGAGAMRAAQQAGGVWDAH